MTDHGRSRPMVHALLSDGTTVSLRPVPPRDHGQLQRLYEELSPENLRLRFFGASRRSATMSADRACAPPRPGCRALPAGTQGRVPLLFGADTGAGDTPA
ncbi:hypothetical protein GCM10027073_46210 [Streptomyces chlorus]|uniref:Acetyltransferase n=1 Tax=Streptomyces chlorus TaxID=887452 RepID=A0ABW1DZ10_9ACTN